MPELPDLLYIKDYLDRSAVGSNVREVSVRRPVVLRNTLQKTPSDALRGRTLAAVEIHGPFLRFSFPPDVDVIINLMLSGRLHHQQLREKTPGYLCASLRFSGGDALHLCDDQQMAKVYLVATGDFTAIPSYASQGIDILSPGFKLEAFTSLVEHHRRKQVRVMINDHAILSSIGNAYADEILFEAGIHPKTIVARLSPAEVENLFAAIGRVMAWGAGKVRDAGQPIHIKVRDHMRVRNRHGEPCPRCGTKIRREGVRGYDVYFCPRCQPATRKLFIDWKEGN
ncbi:MAG: DNA-formamidopyrimidine glycosylase family protein [Bacteroidota bacterium]